LDPVANPDATIPVSEHEAALRVEARRRAGQERAHQKAMGTLQSQLDELRSLVSSASTTPGTATSPARARNLLAQLESGDRDSVLRELTVAVDAWTEHFDKQERDHAARVRTSAAVEDAIADLEDQYPDVQIPRTSLVTTSPEAVRSSAKEYLAEQRIAQLERETAALRSGKSTAEEDAAMAATRTRQELGATRTVTSTGTPPPTPTVLQEEIAQLEQEAGRLKRLRKGDDLMAVNRRLTQARDELALSRR
jgi:hypothetical protein